MGPWSPAIPVGLVPFKTGGDTEGRWSDVKSNLHSAGRTMYEHTQRIAEQIKRDDVCGNLAKEERNSA